MKIFRNFTGIAVILIAMMLIAGCATGPATARSSYIEAEKQWKGLVDDYLIWKQANMIDPDLQKKVEGLFIKASDVLDMYKIAILAGSDTGDYITQLNNLKREILLELAKAKQ